MASGIQPTVQYGPPRAGDVRDSLTDIRAAQNALGFQPQVDMTEGLKEYVEWAKGEVAS